jgi:CheY-like chemotaxis protein
MEILLVEDSLMDARLTMGALKKGGLQHRLTLIFDGKEAMEFLLRKGRYAFAPRPDLILLDLMLPGKTGWEILSELKACAEFRDIPIIILTAADDENIDEKVDAYHVSHFVRKPVDFDEFLRVVKELKHHWHHDLLLPAMD